MMKLSWDENKNRINIAKHGICFDEAIKLLTSPSFMLWDDVRHKNDDRLGGLGKIGSRLYALCFKELEPRNYRIISLRKANDREKKAYDGFAKTGRLLNAKFKKRARKIP